MIEFFQKFLFLLLFFSVTKGSAQSFDDAEEFIFDFQHFSIESGLPNRFVRDIDVDDEGFVWLLTYEGISRFDGYEYTHYDLGFSIIAAEVPAMLEVDHTGKIWLGYQIRRRKESFHQLKVFDPETKTLKSKEEFSASEMTDLEREIFALENVEQKVQIKLQRMKLKEDEIDIAPLVKGVIKKYRKKHAPQIFSSSVFWGANQDAFGNQWKLEFENYTITKNGKLILDLQEELEQGFNLETGFNALKLGKETAWLCSNEGFFKVTFRPNHFKKYLEGKSTRTLIRLDEKNLLVNVYEGISQVNLETHESEWFYDSIVRSGLPYGGIQDNAGQFWYSIPDSTKTKCRVARFGYPQSSVKFFDLKKDTFLYGNYSAFFEKKLIVGGSSGLGLIDTTGTEMKVFKNFEPYSELADAQFFTSFENEDGLYLGSSMGLVLMDSTFKIKNRFDNEFEGKLGKTITAIWQDSSGIFWLGVRKEGLVRWNQKTNEFMLFNQDNGFLNKNIHAIYEDDFGFLWMPTDYGLIRFNKKTEESTIFLQKDGISHNEFNLFSHHQDSEGNLYFGGLSGVNVFHPKDFQKSIDALQIPLHLTGFEILNGTTGEFEDNYTQLIDNRQITLQPNQRSFRINFALLDFEKEKTNYFYKIEGLERNWSKITGNSFLVNGLPYGNYVLKIKAQTPDGADSANILEYPVKVLMPFYLRTWFLILSGLLFVGLLLLGYFGRVNKLKKETQYLETEVARRTEIISEQKNELEEANNTKDLFFAIIAHDLRAPAISFLGLSKKVKFLLSKGRYERIDEIGAYVEDAAQNLNQLLDNLLNWALLQKGRYPHSPEKISIDAALDEVYRLFLPQLEAKEVTLKIDLESNLIVFADANALATILRNLTNNALKFSHKGGTIYWKGIAENGKAFLEIKDEGVGIEQEKLENILNLKKERGALGTRGEKGTGLGLVLCKDLLELNDGKLSIKSTFGKGTTIRFDLPLSE